MTVTYSIIRKRAMLLLKVTYRVRAHQVEQYENVFRQEGMPLFQELGLQLAGIWRCLTGSAGEYLELWRFDSAAHFEESWNRLMADPRFKAILHRTGPMVEDETLCLLQSVEGLPGDRIGR